MSSGIADEDEAVLDDDDADDCACLDAATPTSCLSPCTRNEKFVIKKTIMSWFTKTLTLVIIFGSELIDQVRS